MKKKTRSFIGISLSMLMTAGMLAGCSGEPASTDQSQDKTVATSAQGNASAAEEEQQGPDVSFPYTGEEVVLKGFGYDGLPQEDTEVARYWQEQIGNVRVEWEFIPYSDFLTKKDVYLASGDIPDILPTNDIVKVAQTYGAEGTLLDYNEYAEYMPNLQNYREQYPNMDYLNSADGKRFAIFGVQPIDFAGESYFVNMDELAKAGITTVPDTLDELLEAMRAVKAADPESIPFLSYWNINYTQQTFARLLNAQKELVYYDTGDNTFKFTYSEPEAKRKELIQLMADMYAEGLINQEIATMSAEQEQALLGQGQWAFSFLYNVGLEKEIFKVTPGDPLPFNIVPMKAPKSADGKRYQPLAYQHDSIPEWGIVSSAETEHPEILAGYMDQVVSPLGRDVFNYGIEGVTYDVVDGKPVMKEGIDKAAMGVGTQYEVWMVGMGPTIRSGEGYLLNQQAIDENLKNFTSGEVIGMVDPVITTFTTEDGEKKANLENTLNTYITEQEARFIYGQRSMSEWDAYVAEVESLINVEELLGLYNNADIIIRESERIYEAD